MTSGTASPPLHIRHIPHLGGKFALVCFRQPIGLAQLYHVVCELVPRFFFSRCVCLPDSAVCVRAELAACVPCHQLHSGKRADAYEFELSPLIGRASFLFLLFFSSFVLIVIACHPSLRLRHHLTTSMHKNVR